MEEFRAAHSKMFGQTSKLIKTQKTGDKNTEETEKKNLSRNSPVPAIDPCFIVQSSKSPPPPPPPNGRVSNDSPIESHANLNNGSDMSKNLSNSGQIKILPPKNGLSTKTIAPSPPKLPTSTSGNGEVVTILRTTSPCKKAPPVPVKKISQLPSHGPLVTISSYEEPKNRFLSKETKQSCKSIITVTSPSNGKLNHTDSDISRKEANPPALITNEPSQSHQENNRNTTDLRPISIKINVK